MVEKLFFVSRVAFGRLKFHTVLKGELFSPKV